MSKIEQATAWMEAVANDPKYGYDQAYRWGERGDYDCSSLCITADEKAGIPVKSAGATYTGNMYAAYTKCGYKNVTSQINMQTGSGLQRGDILLNTVNHVARYVGNGKLVQASINELGRVTGGQPGDQKQLKGLKGEINISPYYNYPWNYVLRYMETDDIEMAAVNVQLPVLKKGMKGIAVGIWQQILCEAGYKTTVDESFGPKTEAKTIEFEKSRGITECPEQVGPSAWRNGLDLLKAK